MAEVSGPTFTCKVFGPTFSSDQAPGPTFVSYVSASYFMSEVSGPTFASDVYTLSFWPLDQPSCLRSLDRPSRLARPLGLPSHMIRSLDRPSRPRSLR